MAGGKETPRQKMIGMMYLVLLALLAMNVSKQIIMAFVTLNNNMESQNQTFVATNVDLLYSFEQSKANLKAQNASEDDLKMLEMWQERAKVAHSSAVATVNTVITFADEMLQAGGSGEWVVEDKQGYLGMVDLANHESDYPKKDDYDTPTRMFVNEGRGEKILTKIAEFRDSLCMAIGDIEDSGKKYSFTPIDVTRENTTDTTYLNAVIDAMEEQGVHPDAKGPILEIYRILTFPAKLDNHGEEVDWVIGQFDHAPIVAAAAILTSIKGQVLQAERVALQFFSSRNSVPPFKFDTIEPKAFARTGYINTGDSLSLEVMIAAYDSKAETEIRYAVDADTAKPISEWATASTNKVLLGRELGGEVGDHFVKGQIAVEEKGVKKWKDFDFRYKVGAPSTAIGNAEMNVMYIGYDNIISASGSGYSDVTASCSGCASWGKSGDNYKARVTAGRRTVNVTLTGTNKAGEKETIGTQEFRVLPMPRPRVYVIGVDPFASNIARSALAAGYLRAELIGSPLTIASQVTGGAVTVTVQGVSQTYPMQGNKIPAAAANIIRQLRPGATVMIETTCLLGGAPVKPAPISYKVT